MKLKTKKLLKKRVKVTGKKKVLIRTGGQNHFNARESSKVTKNKRRDKQISSANMKNVKKLLPYL
ncbi:50S ribosomal protein L35 [Candidatus Parcubacteria bacterium]|jgi:ribosomal protein L35|nr:50S ribosomal protein L35 [Candidatus Parcubacteria bacterium]MBT7227997.1 50S ribosomal protein L35 [Candidatus Parcubacteria bacterium]